MLKSLLKGIFISLGLLLLSNNLFANHILGGEITYKFISRNATTGDVTYEITLKIYRDPQPNGKAFEQVAPMGAYLDGPSVTKNLAETFYLNKVDSGQVYASAPFNTNCNLTPDYSIFQVVYRGNVVLPKSAVGYYITWAGYARVTTSTNLDNSSQGITYTAYIPPTDISNNSAVFRDIPVTSICAGDTVSVLNAATDKDTTDVLKYEFSEPYQGYGAGSDPPPPSSLDIPMLPVSYGSGYTYNNPMGPSGYAYTDAYTGVSTYKASGIGNYLVLVQITEYRNGRVVGITRRDIQINSKSCPSTNRPGPVYSSGGAVKDKFYVKAGEKICFPITFTAADPTKDSILVTTTSSLFNSSVTAFPATLTGKTRDKGVIDQTVCWQTDCSQGSATPYLVYTSAKDNVCPPIAPITQTIKIYVLRNKPVISGLNLVCPLQKFVKYTVADTAVGSTYKWQVTGGVLNTAAGDSIRVDWNDPAIKGVVTVIEKSRAGCFDTTNFDVAINRITPISAGADRTVCHDDSTTVLGPPGGAIAGYTYKWTPAQGLSNPNIAAPKLALPNNTGADLLKTYSLHVQTPDGCYSDDQVVITIHPRSPVSIAATPSTICKNDVTSMLATSGYTYKWYLQGSATVLSAANPFTATPAVSSTYTVVATDNFSCTNNTDVAITVNQLPTIFASTTADSICIGGTAQLKGNGGVFYTWAYQATPNNILSNSQKFTVSPPATQVYIVEGIDGNNCKNTATIKVFVNPLPNIIVLASDDSICPATTTRLDPKNGVSYLWYNSLAPTVPLSNNNPYFVAPTITTTYNVTGTDVHGCSNSVQKEIFVFNTPQTKPVMGSPYVCTNSKGVSFIIPGGVSTSIYHWTVDGSASIVSSTQGNDTLKVDFAQADTIQITVQETSKQGCLGAILTYKVIVILDYTPPAPDGIDTLCSRDKDMVVYSAANGSSGFFYEWHISAGGTKLHDDSTSTVTIKWNRIGNKIDSIYYVQVSRTAIPACRFTSAKTYITIYPTPTTSSIKGDTTICKGDKAVIYQVNGFFNSTYLWKINGGKITDDSTKTFITVDWDVSGALNVLETSDKGCPGYLIKQNVIINPLPVAGPVTGTFTICPTNTVGQVYTTSGASTSRFSWKVIGGTIKSGNGTKSVTIDWDFSNKTPSIAVNEISKDSCTGPTVNAPNVVQDEASARILVTTTNETNDRQIDINWDKSINANGAANKDSLFKRSANGPWTVLGSNLIAPNYSDYNVNTHQVIYEYRYSTKDLCNQNSTSVPTNSILLGGTNNEASKKANLIWNNYHNWTRSLNRYEVWRKLDDEADFSFYSNNGKDTSVTFTNGNDGFKHRYRIKSIEDLSGRYAWSNDTTLTFEHKIDIPNAYSPNGDGVNDKWEIKDVEVYTNTDIQIFDRWGALVYSNPNYKNEWDGRSTGGKELPDGTYYYIIKLGGKQAFGKDAYNGNVTILR